MYMRNNKYSKYNIDGFPEHYSGQYRTIPEIESENKDRGKEKPEFNLHNQHDHKENREEPEEHKEKEKREGSPLGNLFGRHKDGKKGGLLGGLFNKDGKDVGFLSNIELDDLILLAVIFFLLKDGLEDDLILILAIILFSS